MSFNNQNKIIIIVFISAIIIFSVNSGLNIEVKNEEVSFLFDSNIEGGSGNVIKLGNFSYSIIMNYDYITNDPTGQEIGNEMYWWLFNITQGPKNKTIEFWVPQSFTESEGIAFGSTIAPKMGQWPVFSENNGTTWNYINSKDIRWIKPDKDFDRYYLQFNYTMNSEFTLLSVAYPYLYTDLEEYAEYIKKLDYVDVEWYNSTQNRKTYIFTISEQKNSQIKPTIWIISGQEPSETWSQIINQGILEFLVSNNSEAIEYREKYTWKITPMINPDGNSLGKTQRNANNIDITKEWDEYKTDTIEVEINGTLAAMENWIRKGNKISLFIDLHTSYTHNWQIIYPSNRILEDEDTNKIQLIKESIANGTIWGYGRSFPWSNREKSSQAVYLMFKIPSLLLEGSQWQRYIISYPEEVATIEVLKEKGIELVRAIDYVYAILD